MSKIKFIWSAIFCFVSCFALCAFFAAGVDSETQKKMDTKKETFIVIYKPSKAWKAGKPVSEQPLQEHGKYLLGLFKSGILRFAGPFADDTGGAAVLEVADETEAKNLLARDPAVTSGVMVYELHPWRLVPWENYLKKTSAVSTKNEAEMKKEETVFACNPTAMDKKQRARYSVSTKQLFAGKREVQELADGYAVSFAANPQTIKDAAEFITYERLCCPFLNFEMAVEGENLQLRLKGAEGVKEFLKSELGV